MQRCCATLPLCVIGTATDAGRVNPRVRELFGDELAMRPPSRHSRRRAAELLCAALGAAAGRVSAEALDALAEEGGGAPLLALLQLWVPRIAAVLASDRDGGSNSRATRTEEPNIRDADLSSVLPLGGVHGLGAVKEAVREMIVWPRVHAQVPRSIACRCTAFT